MSETIFDYNQQIENLGLLKNQIKQQQDNYTLRKARANLFFDDNAMIEYLASERFPNDNQGALKYKNIDGELYYENPNGEAVFGGKKYSKEFPNNEAVGFLGDKVVPNLVPFSTFSADVGGGMVGAKRGFEKGQKLSQSFKHPLAKAAVILSSTGIGATLGTTIFGTGARVGREGLIDMFYNAPPEEIAAALQDLETSAKFSLIPFGTGTTGTANLVMKFKGNKDALQYLINLRGSTDETIQEAKRLGFDLTSAQAGRIGSRGQQLQYFLSRQPEITKITQFYDSQAAQISATIREMADSFGSGKTVGDINTRIKDTGVDVLEELTRRRKERATRLYNIIKEAPEGIRVNKVQSVVDSIDSKIAGEVLNSSGKVIRTIEPDPNTVKVLTEFRKTFYDADGALIDDLATLDARRTSSMQKIIKSTQDEGTGDFGLLLGLRDDLTKLMDESEPLYALARRVYDPTKPSLQLVEKSVIGKFGKLMTDKQTSTAMKNLFDPDVSIKSLRNARRVLQTADPELFQDVKKQFILGQLDKFSKLGNLQKGMPNFQKYFLDPKVDGMMKEMLSPEEYTNFYRMNELVGKAFSVPTSGSPTQPLSAEFENLAQEALGTGTNALKLFYATARVPGRILSGQIGDDLVANISAKQRDKYFEAMTEVLLDDPNAAKTLDDVFNYVSTKEFGLKQSLIRGGDEGIEAITEPSEKPYTGEQRGDYIQDLEKQIDALSNPQSMNVTPPKPTLAPQQMMSPTILPNEDDREIAMRRQTGIAGLV